MPKNRPLMPRQITDSDVSTIGKLSADDLQFKIITEPDSWLEVAYAMLVDQFDENVLDSLESYVDWLKSCGAPQCGHSICEGTGGEFWRRLTGSNDLPCFFR